MASGIFQGFFSCLKSPEKSLKSGYDASDSHPVIHYPVVIKNILYLDGEFN